MKVDGSMQNVEVMNKEQFRAQMGILGQQQHPFLADRIFEVFDMDRDGRINFQAFSSIMDVLCNGSEDERNMFGFALMDTSQNGVVTFDEFYNYFSQVIAHWSSMINSHVRISRAEILKIFQTIDIDGDGSVFYSEYRKALRKNPELLDWFELLNSNTYAQDATPTPPAKSPEEEEQDKNTIRIDPDQI